MAVAQTGIDTDFNKPDSQQQGEQMHRLSLVYGNAVCTVSLDFDELGAHHRHMAFDAAVASTVAGCRGGWAGRELVADPTSSRKSFRGTFHSMDVVARGAGHRAASLKTAAGFEQAHLIAVNIRF